ncbi:MAG TPA: hypothetical protein VMQ50_09600 [Casimicrobiaceae bacterium]|nr:hypothetical protein [Casimicrobiaceae bacterium]
MNGWSPAKLLKGAGLPFSFLATLAITPGAGSASPDANEGRAEVQLALCAPADRIVRTLNMQPRGGPVTVWQFDDKTLGLYARGLRLRLRVTADGRSELTLKVADIDCLHADPVPALSGTGKCEYDVYETSTTSAVSLNRRLDARQTVDLLGGRIAMVQALGSAQIAYLRSRADSWPLPPGIRKLGPMALQTYRSAEKRYDLDVSRLPDGQRYVEISRKVPLADAASAMEAMRKRVEAAGITACSDQSSQALAKLRSLLRQE